MHYDVWWLYHFRRENSFRTFYRRFSGLIFGTRNNSVRWLLIFGCAQDDTQRVEQEGVCACTRAPRCDRKFFGRQVFRNTPRCARTTPTYALLRRRVKNSVFWQTPKKMQLLKCKRHARGRAAFWRAYSRARAQNHTTDSAQQGDEHRSRYSTSTHTRTFTHIHVHERTYTNAAHKRHTCTWTCIQTYAVSAGI